MPENRSWNGDLVIYAHGYVAFNEPIHIPDLTLPDGTSIPDLVNALGYAFATTSYSTNGLAVREGIEDVRDLIGLFTSAIGDPDMVYLVGASEGGLVATLAVEGFPSDFQGGLALCGPIGDFRRQVDYWGDFRVIWDVFFPGVIPGSAIDIPPQVIEQWDTLYEPEVSEAIAQKKAATAQLIHVTGASIDPKDPATVDDTVTGLLWYNVFATNDGVAKLGGQPFGNASRVYTGSRDDLRLNLAVERFQPDQAALDEIEAHYQTSGNLISPLVTMHTTGDPIIPYWHEVLYQAKVINGGSRALYAHIPIRRYGHCEFKTSEVLAAFALLVRKVTANELRDAEAVLTDGDARDAYLEMAREYGAID
jgi:pimeloyl-ACP methyl ester carboxylesterase